MVVITHGEPRHQHAWLPLHKPPTHGKDLALLLMMGKTLEVFSVDRVMHSFSALGDPRIMYTINISTGVSAQIPLDMKYSLMGATVSKEGVARGVVSIIHTSTSKLGAFSRH